MTLESLLQPFFGQSLLVGLALTRIATAFVLLPLLSQETVPALVRNSLFLAFGLIVLAYQPQILSMQLSIPQLMTLFAKEAFVGLVIGFLFGTLLWAFEAAGQIIDTKVGATMAQVVDPLSGHTTSLNGEFLGRLANFVFMFSGGLLLLVGVILESYAVWPISELAPALKPAGVRVFETEFSRLLTYAVVFAAPALVVLFVVDAGLGLVNRYAPQLNVFSLGMAIKAWLATFILLAIAGGLIQLLMNDMASRSDFVLNVLRAIVRGETLG